MKISDDQNTITLDDGRTFRAVPEIEPDCEGCDLEPECRGKFPCVPTRTVGDGMRKDGAHKIFRNAAQLPQEKNEAVVWATMLRKCSMAEQHVLLSPAAYLRYKGVEALIKQRDEALDHLAKMLAIAEVEYESKDIDALAQARAFLKQNGKA